MRDTPGFLTAPKGSLGAFTLVSYGTRGLFVMLRFVSVDTFHRLQVKWPGGSHEVADLGRKGGVDRSPVAAGAFDLSRRGLGVAIGRGGCRGGGRGAMCSRGSDVVSTE